MDFFFNRFHSVVQTGLKLNSWEFSCLSLPSIEITCMSYHTWLSIVSYWITDSKVAKPNIKLNILLWFF